VVLEEVCDMSLLCVTKELAGVLASVSTGMGKAS
jgi:hypothetical protein